MVTRHDPLRSRGLPTEELEGGLLERSDAQLGRGVPVARGGVPVPLIQAAGSSQRARMATLHAQVTDLVFPTAVLDRRAPIVGLLQWGQGGASFKADIDLRTGVCASLVASSVTLSVRIDGNDPEIIEGATVAAAVVWGTRPGRCRATRTLPRETIAPAASFTWAVPSFAYSLQLFTPIAAFYAPASTSIVTLHEGPLVTDDPELAIAAGALTVQPLTLDGLALSGNTRFATVQNLTGAPLPIRPTFCLEL